VVAGELDELKNELRGTIVETRKSKLGLLLSPPSSLDGDVVGVRLARSQTGKLGAGRGWFAQQGETTLVQVPLV
jgi:S-DNA-T family DNA segregation ATPase FtsK/SpoIIIE